MITIMPAHVVAGLLEAAYASERADDRKGVTVLFETVARRGLVMIPVECAAPA